VTSPFERGSTSSGELSSSSEPPFSPFVREILSQFASVQGFFFIKIVPPPQLCPVFDGVSSFSFPLVGPSSLAGIVKVRGSDRHFPSPLSATRVI